MNLDKYYYFTLNVLRKSQVSKVKLQFLYHLQISLNRGLLILDIIYTKNQKVGLVFEKLLMNLVPPNTHGKII